MARHTDPAQPRQTTPHETITRRSLLEWLGTGTVLALGGASFAACLDDVTPRNRLGSMGDNVGGDSALPPGGDQFGLAFPFYPSEATAERFSDFTVFTADPQNLSAILATWELTVDGMVETPLTLRFAKLVNDIPRFDTVVDFHCVTGWSVLDVPWNGVHLSELFDRVSPSPDATHVTFHTITGVYNESLPLEIASEPNTLLAYGVDGNTVPFVHGFPLRLVVPRLWAYKSAKYVTRVELTNQPVNAYWEQRGYSYAAEVPGLEAARRPLLSR